VQYQANREDVYVYLSRSKKAINMAAIEQQLRQQSEHGRLGNRLHKEGRHRKAKSRQSGPLLYKYFSSHHKKAVLLPDY
jgi:hypothetical protein